MNLDPTAFVADPSLIQGLQEGSTPVVCSEDRILFRQGDEPRGLFILNAGRAFLTMTSAQGTEILSSTAAPGSLLGLPGLLGNEPYTLTAIAESGAELSFLSRENFASRMAADHMLAFKILGVLAAEVRSARNAILQR